MGESGYLRSADGTVVHRTGCSRAGQTAVEWHYPENHFGPLMRHKDVLELVMALSWLRACRYCMRGDGPAAAAGTEEGRG